MTPTYTPELLAALILFAFASAVTPGPNNTMLMASGANFGLRRTAPHMAGVTTGFLALIAMCGLGLGGVFAASPTLHAILKWGGAAYLLYLAWRIATADGVGKTKTASRPMTMLGAFAFQFINPKGWVMALGAVSTYVPARGYLANLLVALLVFAVVNVFSVVVWTTFGLGLRRFLDRPVILRWFNISMALLLVASLYPLFSELRR